MIFCIHLNVSNFNGNVHPVVSKIIETCLIKCKKEESLLHIGQILVSLTLKLTKLEADTSQEFQVLSVPDQHDQTWGPPH